MDRLRPLDSAFLQVEHPDLPMHIGSVLTLAGPPPTSAAIRESVLARLADIPRYRQTVQSVPLHLGQPVWVDDPAFDIDFHLRRTALASPGGDAELAVLAGRLFSSPLDLHRPLWEMWIVEGLSGDRFAVVNKVHHAMIDGLSGSDLMEHLLDHQPHPPAAASSPWRPQPAPDRIRLIGGALADEVRQPLQRVAQWTDRLREPGELARSAAAAAAGTLGFGRRIAHFDHHLMGAPGGHRRWTWTTVELARIKEIKNRRGGTVNDVVLTAVAGAFRNLLIGRGVELAPDDSVRSLVPVSTRAPDEGAGGNRVAAMFADLPVGIADPVQRHAAVVAQLTALKHSGMTEGTQALVANAVFVPAPALAAGLRLLGRTAQHAIGTVTTNVPGPRTRLYLLGRPVNEILPYVPLGMNQLITVAIFSYLDQVAFGFTADYAKVPDIDTLPPGVQATLSDLAV